MSRQTIAILTSLPLLLLVFFQASPWLLSQGPLNFEMGSDWDWQATLYETCRQALFVHHQFPTWDPFTQGGIPLLGNPESPCLYPGMLLPGLLGTERALPWLALVHLLFLVGAGWWAGRTLGLSPVGAHGASFFLLSSDFLAGFIAEGRVMFLMLGWTLVAWAAFRTGRLVLSSVALSLTYLGGGHYLLLFGLLLIGVEALLSYLPKERARWLGLPLLANGLLLGAPLNGRLGAVLIACLVLLSLGMVLRPGAERLRKGGSSGQLASLLLVGLGIVILAAPKLLHLSEVVSRSARFEETTSTAEAESSTRAIRTLIGAAPPILGSDLRPGRHEGPNSFHSPIPLVVGGLGLLLVLWRAPVWGVMALFFWSLSWSDWTPLNLLDPLRHLPGFSLLRNPQRFSLLWTAFLGWGAGFLLDHLWQTRTSWGRFVSGSLLVLLIWGANLALPHLMSWHQQLAPTTDQAPPISRGDFVQTRSKTTLYFDSVRANQGRLDSFNAIALRAPSKVLTDTSDPNYQGEAWRGDGGPIEASIRMAEIHVSLPQPGRFQINQNHFAGWRLDGRPAGSSAGTISEDLPAGHYELRYWPKWTSLAVLIWTLGWLAVLGYWLRRLRRSLRVRLAALALGSLIAFAAAELLLRVFDVEDRYLLGLTPVQAADISMHQEDPDPEILYRLRPHSVHIDSAEIAHQHNVGRTITTDGRGYRNGANHSPDPAEVFRVVALGGSNTYGAMVSDHETWPAQLQAQLMERGYSRVEVLNLGVSGYEWRQKLALAMAEYRLLKPDLWIIQIGNDGPRYVLSGTDIVGRVRSNPELLDEFVPELETGEGRALLESPFRLPAVLRFAKILRDRHLSLGSLLAGDRGANRGVTPEVEAQGMPRRAARGARAWKQFQRHPAGDTPVLFLETPVPASNWQRHLAGERLLQLSRFVDSAPTKEAAQSIHPGAPAYVWYASILADELERAGLLSGQTPEGPVPSESAEDTSRLNTR